MALDQAAPPDDGPPLTAEIDVEAGVFRGRALGLRGLWSYRELFLALVWRDVKARYSQTSVGLAWAVLQPALMTGAFSLFFQPAEEAGAVPYPVYVYSGFLAWTFFAGALLAAGQSVVAAEGVLTKAYFPRLLLPWAAATALLVDLAVGCGGLALLMACYGIGPGWGVLLLPGCALAIALAAGGVGTLFAALNVTYRDFRYLAPFLVQVWMFSTPLLFLRPGALPAWARSRPLLLALNPMNGLAGFFRAAALGQPLPWQEAGLAALSAAGMLLAGCWYFRRVEHSFADII